MKKIKQMFIKLNTKFRLCTAKLTQPLKNNKGSYIVEVIAVIAVIIIIAGIFTIAMKDMTENNLSAMSSKMSELWS